MISTPSSSSASFNNASVTDEAVAMPQLPNSLPNLSQLSNSIQTPPLMPPPVLTPEPKFNLVSFNVTSVQNLGALLTINNQVC